MLSLSRQLCPGPATEAGFLQTITALSDLQLFTGLSLLICGYAIVGNGMMGYHWLMITRLAWFSTITHLAALSSWHRRLYQRVSKRTLRLVLMGCLAVMFMAAIMVTADERFDPQYYAVCYMRVPRPGFNIADPDVVSSCVLIASNIMIRLFKLYSITTEQRFKTIRYGIVQLIRRAVSKFCLWLHPHSLQVNLFGLMAFLQPLMALLMYLEIVT
ncbi:hypothetical protein PG996_004906 [Apiospora saccharicola]|uniref:Uncharacterized protein n=1 Tax=Apiospora saccharicola TaxID=335842 RepID=A0ABR1VK09_9PEZI